MYHLRWQRRHWDDLPQLQVGRQRVIKAHRLNNVKWWRRRPTKNHLENTSNHSGLDGYRHQCYRLRNWNTCSPDIQRERPRSWWIKLRRNLLGYNVLVFGEYELRGSHGNPSHECGTRPEQQSHIFASTAVK